jgi:hypothetical protein
MGPGGATAARATARIALAAVFAWHGLVPKLVVRHPDEMAPLLDAGVPENMAAPLVLGTGVAEIALAVCIVVLWRRRWPSLACLAFVVPVTFLVAAVTPRLLLAAFNPLTLNVCVAALAVVDLVLLREESRGVSADQRAG